MASESAGALIGLLAWDTDPASRSWTPSERRARASQPVGLRRRRDLSERSVPFLDAGADAGETVITVVDQRKWAILREELGPACEPIAPR